jgi:UPF0042 nucleotide-binding protein
VTLDVTIITGMSGAGRSASADVLEDLGFFVIDNLPPALVAKVAELGRGTEGPQKFALVIDVRSGEFVDALVAALAELREMGASTRVLFLDAADDVLVRRYEATRRKHPLAAGDRVSDGIASERNLLEELKGEADIVLDTTELNVHELRDRLRELFDVDQSAGALQTSIVSFGYKHGLPLDVDLVFDCRFLPNPHWIEELRPQTGLDEPVRDYVLSRPGAEDFIESYARSLEPVLAGYRRENKRHATIALGCTGGKHRSVAIAEELGRRLSALPGLNVTVQHRDLGRE